MAKVLVLLDRAGVEMVFVGLGVVVLLFRDVLAQRMRQKQEALFRRPLGTTRRYKFMATLLGLGWILWGLWGILTALGTAFSK